MGRAKGAGPWAGPLGGGPGSAQERQGVIHVVAGGDFENGEEFDREIFFEDMTAEGTCGHGQGSEQTAEDQKGSAQRILFR